MKKQLKVVIVGTTGTGKTTLAREISELLSSNRIETVVHGEDIQCDRTAKNLPNLADKISVDITTIRAIRNSF